VQITTDTDFHETYCGTEVPGILSVDATSMDLKFVSDTSVVKSGFEITYKISARKGYQLSIY